MTRALRIVVAVVAGAFAATLLPAVSALAGFRTEPRDVAAGAVDAAQIIDQSVTGDDLASTLTLTDRAIAIDMSNSAGAGEDLTVQGSSAAASSAAASGSVAVHVEDGDGAGADGNIDLYLDGTSSLLRIYSGSTAIAQVDATGAQAWGSGSTAHTELQFGTCSVNPTSINAHTCAATTGCSATGITSSFTNILAVGPADLTVGLVKGNSPVTATTNSITFRICNITDAAIDGAAKTWSWRALR
jgi:hypothetical protein